MCPNRSPLGLFFNATTHLQSHHRTTKVISWGQCSLHKSSGSSWKVIAPSHNVTGSILGHKDSGPCTWQLTLHEATGPTHKSSGLYTKLLAPNTTVTGELPMMSTISQSHWPFHEITAAITAHVLYSPRLLFGPNLKAIGLPEASASPPPLEACGPRPTYKTSFPAGGTQLSSIIQFYILYFNTHSFVKHVLH